MNTLWASFARTGVPSAPGQPAWPAYNLNTRAPMVIGAQCQVIDECHRDERLAWRALGI